MSLSYTRLLHNMQRLGLSQLVPWTSSFLSDRCTRIKLPGYISDTFQHQLGSPISPILFLLFNTPLVQGCSLHGVDGARTSGFGWVNDIAITAMSDTYRRNVEMLQAALGHAAKFTPDKFELIHFTNLSTIDPPSDPQNHSQTTAVVVTPKVKHSRVWTIQIEGSDVYDVPTEPPPGTDRLPVHTASGLVIKPATSAKHLGIWLDKQLNFDTHRTELVGKATGSLEALRGISGSTWGASLTAMRMVY
ncbi:hypothetical protein N7493_000786 [Penicillium malachiteum]|uniref:Reverse transcriptase domain-containing protein n=1 Tax=Penicillium malachiteum TaxID=1324776 RepID=A0AAD6HX05_9EURO|nr:hypothetical protein N7493_000786 [Penicillium malachiteum]